MKALKSEVARLQSEARDNNEARQQHNSILKRLEHSLNEANSLAEQYKYVFEIDFVILFETIRIMSARLIGLLLGKRSRSLNFSSCLS